MGPGLLREGIVIRPLLEEKDKNGKRVIYKFVNKCPPFSELKDRPNLGEMVKVMTNQKEIVDQWVTQVRMQHVLDDFKSNLQNDEENKRMETNKLIPEIVSLFVKDVQKEHNGSIVWSSTIEKAIKSAAGTMFVHHFLDDLKQFIDSIHKVEKQKSECIHCEIVTENRLSQWIPHNRSATMEPVCENCIVDHLEMEQIHERTREFYE
jgi:hypothetical protein